MTGFKSLNCILCNGPFVSVAKQARSSRDLQYGLAMCSECFENILRTTCFTASNVFRRFVELVHIRAIVDTTHSHCWKRRRVNYP
ncbi:unnamed protein product, partial [Mesorhabditis belari]|uniref:Uncharacterized protein n=1 Tax=Mesorhabditis belari TaxID=2138241 RepID=A0AAF3EDB7_9BILA